jgi:hypothetical protein
MQHAENDDSLGEYLVKHLVRKPPEQHAAKIAEVKARMLRITLQLPHRSGHLIEKYVTQP